MFDYDEDLVEQKKYKERNKEIFKYYNAHPKSKDVGDCVKRAITKATGKDYKEVQLELNRYKKITKTKVFNEQKNFEKYIVKELEGQKLKGFNNIKIGEFAKSHTKGTYIVTCRKHLTCIVNGIIYDTWNPSFKAINKIWEVR